MSGKKKLGMDEDEFEGQEDYEFDGDVAVIEDELDGERDLSDDEEDEVVDYMGEDHFNDVAPGDWEE